MSRDNHDGYVKTWVDPETRKGLKLEFYRESDTWDWTDIDHLGHLALAHSKYLLGDSQATSAAKNAEYIVKHLPGLRLPEGASLSTVLEKVKKHAFAYRVYMVDHSGLSFSLHDPQDRWDGGSVGITFCTAKQARAFWGLPRNSDLKDLEQRVREHLKAELEEYERWSAGDVWSWRVEETTEPVPAGVPDDKLCHYVKHVADTEDTGDSGWTIAYQSDAEEQMADDVRAAFPRAAEAWWGPATANPTTS